MPANPERMRPTPLSNAPIVQEANQIVGVHAHVLREVSEKGGHKDAVRVIDLFLMNTIAEPKEQKPKA